MEVTSSNSNQFTPKLGQVSKGNLASADFSSHLAEHDPAPRPEPRNQPGRDQRDQNDARTAADARSDAIADERRRNNEATERKRSDEAREREKTEEARASAQKENTETGNEVSVTDDASFDETILDALGANATSTDTEEQATSTEVAVNTESAATSTEPKLTEANQKYTPLDNAQEEALVEIDADEVPLASHQQTSGEEATETATDPKAVAAAHSPSNARATSDTAQTAVQQAVRTADHRGPGNGPNTQADTIADDPVINRDALLGAANPESDGDLGSEDQPGLGAKMAEAMASKNKSSTAFEAPNTTPAKASVTQPAPVVSAGAATSLPPIVLQSLASLGLSTNGLPAGLDFDQLGLSNAGQTTSTPQNSNPVLVRFGVLPGQAQATQVPNTAIAMQIAKHVAKGVSTFEIRLDPAELGRVDVKLELTQEGHTRAHLVVERPETLDLLQRDAKALEQALRDAGLDTDEASLEFSLGDKSFQANAEEERSSDNEANQAPAETETTTETTRLSALAARQIQAASRGGIDVSI